MSLQLITKAVAFATAAHDGQFRKYTGEPYIVHPMAVAKTVADFGGDTNQVIAAYLHDTIEDVEEITEAIIKANFGDDITMLVVGMTKHTYPKTVKRREKKQLEAVRLAACDGRVQTIKCADIIDNSGSIIQYDTSFAETYLEENFKTVQGMTGAQDNIRSYALAVLEAELSKLEVLKKTVDV